MSKRTPEPEQPQPSPSLYEAWAGLQPIDWRSAIWSAAEAVWIQHASYQQLQQQLERLMERAEREADVSLALDIENVAGAHWQEAIKVGALMGSALSRTWPRRLEDLDTWIARAMAYADTEHEPLTRARLKAGEPMFKPGEPVPPSVLDEVRRLLDDHRERGQ